MNPDSMQWLDTRDWRAVTLTLQPIPNRVWIEQLRAPRTADASNTGSRWNPIEMTETATLHTHTDYDMCTPRSAINSCTQCAKRAAQLEICLLICPSELGGRSLKIGCKFFQLQPESCEQK